MKIHTVAEFRNVFARLSGKGTNAGVAQLAERLIRNQEVAGSTPVPSSTLDEGDHSM